MASPQLSPTLGPRVNILSLPDEIIHHIMSLSDYPTALNLSLVALRFVPIADSLRWYHLHLVVPDHPPSVSSIDPLCPSAIANARDDEEDVADALLAKIRSILRQANPRRVAMVRALTMVPRELVLDELVDVFDLVFPALVSLSILAPAPHPCQSHWRPPTELTLDNMIFHADFTFPVLRRLTIGRYAYRFKHFVPHLAHCAPNLEILDIDIVVHPDDIAHKDEDDDRKPDYGSLPKPHLTIHTARVSHAVTRGEEVAACQAVGSHFLYLPSLLRLSVMCDFDTYDSLTDAFIDKRREAMAGMLAGISANLKLLEELAWNFHPSEITACLQWEGFQIPNLRRLVLGPMTTASAILDLPSLPNLEVITYSTSGVYGGPFGHFLSPQPMPPALATSLRGSPNLHKLIQLPFDTQSGDLDIFEKLDNISSLRSAAAIFSSVRRDKDELLFAEVKLDPRTIHTSMADYKGRSVPWSIIEEMRVMEGIKRKDWKGRGISVRSETWAILTSWYEAQ